MTAESTSRDNGDIIGVRDTLAWDCLVCHAFVRESELHEHSKRAWASVPDIEVEMLKLTR